MAKIIDFILATEYTEFIEKNLYVLCGLGG